MSYCQQAFNTLRTLFSHKRPHHRFLGPCRWYNHSHKARSANPFVCLCRGRLLAQVWIKIVCVFGGLVIGDQVSHHLSGFVKLVQIIGEWCRPLVSLHEGISFAHAIVLSDNPFEQLHI